MMGTGNALMLVESFVDNEPFVVAYPDDIVLGETEYGLTFCSAIAKDNIIATQFHPEKSGEIGLKMIKKFIEKN